MELEKIFKNFRKVAKRVFLLAFAIGLMWGFLTFHPMMSKICNGTEVVNIASLNESAKIALIGYVPWNMSNATIIGFIGDNAILRRYHYFNDVPTYNDLFNKSFSYNSLFASTSSLDISYVNASSILKQTYRCNLTTTTSTTSTLTTTIPMNSSFSYNSGYDAGFSNGTIFGIQNEYACMDIYEINHSLHTGYCSVWNTDKLNKSIKTDICFWKGTIGGC